MNIRRKRWADVAATGVALLGAIQLCDAVSLPPSRSLAAGLLFVSSFFGIQRLCSAAVDIVFILCKPAPAGDNRAA